MIFISSSCVKKNKIKDSVKELAMNGFKNIELSGGTNYYENFDLDLLDLKKEYGLNYRCHNYFPPPKAPFVLNLASLNNNTFNISFQHVQRALNLSRVLGASQFGFHAGFFIDIKLNEIGKKLSKDNLFNASQSINRFCDAFKLLQKEANGINLYIENNVFSSTNSEVFQGENPFMMTNFSDYNKLKEKINFNLLLDVAHLKVSAKTLGLDWESEIKDMINESNYIHVSNNDGYHDLNNQLTKKSKLFNLIKASNTKGKSFTLEVYDGMDKIKSSYEVLGEAVYD
tara:strand:- start:254 stop:1108 length:855 start_codon:yes stop_codon:yes gene_type:complete